jgi:hypothetical protein
MASTTASADKNSEPRQEDDSNKIEVQGFHVRIMEYMALGKPAIQFD